MHLQCPSRERGHRASRLSSLPRALGLSAERNKETQQKGGRVQHTTRACPRLAVLRACPRRAPTARRNQQGSAPPALVLTEKKTTGLRPALALPSRARSRPAQRKGTHHALSVYLSPPERKTAGERENTPSHAQRLLRTLFATRNSAQEQSKRKAAVCQDNRGWAPRLTPPALVSRARRKTTPEVQSRPSLLSPRGKQESKSKRT